MPSVTTAPKPSGKTSSPPAWSGGSATRERDQQAAVATNERHRAQREAVVASPSGTGPGSPQPPQGVQYHVVAIIAPVLASSMVEVSSKGQDDRGRGR